MSLEAKRITIKATNKETPLELKVIPGHFVTNHSHINYYMDMTSMKMISREALEVARALAAPYVGKGIEAILCLDGTQVIGAMLAELLAGAAYGKDTGKARDIAVITPEQNANTSQLILRDNMKGMVKGKKCVILVASVTTGYTIHKGVETVKFYGGAPMGISAIFSNIKHMDNVEVDAIFTVKDLPKYRSYDYTNCPYCEQKMKVDALVNGHGYSEI